MLAFGDMVISNGCHASEISQIIAIIKIRRFHVSFGVVNRAPGCR